MLNNLLDNNNLSDFFNVLLFSSPIIVASGYILSHVYDFFFDCSYTIDSDLIIYDNSLHILKTSFYNILKTGVNSFNLIFPETINAHEYFLNIKTIVRHHSQDNYDFFLNRMHKNYKNHYINLLNLLRDDISLEDFIKEKNYDIILCIINKKILQI